uniref:Uncharacterized protein n=1 Tax=Strongyloides venezuelensis TaxID=75913 RepID=A0A0K0FPN7_STRVS
MEFAKKFDHNDISSVLLMETCYKDMEISGNDSIEEVVKNIESLFGMNHTYGSCSYNIFKNKKYLGRFVQSIALYLHVLNAFSTSSNALTETVEIN